MKYWSWLARAGWKRFIDRWLALHFCVGIGLSSTVPVCASEAANTVLLPLAGIFVGLSFAWGGNAQALLQTDEIERLAEHRDGGITEYVLVYQTAILVILCCVALWGLAGLKLFDQTWPTPQNVRSYFAVKCVLYVSASVALRECWHVVLGAQHFLVLRSQIREEDKKRKRDGKTG